jgi:tetratricopeptide (TPR) repeat protein
MMGSAKFWLFISGLLIFVGVAVFAVTRHFYAAPAGAGGTVQQAAPAAAPAPSLSPAGQASLAWPDQDAEADLQDFMGASPAQSFTSDPAEALQQAYEFFENRQYQQAADLYQHLLDSGLRNVNVYNELGITLQYLGRTQEALRVLNEGISLDPSYQRIWLTLGFVNGQAGNIEQARSALSTAVQMGADTEVGRSAAKMLEGLM